MKKILSFVLSLSILFSSYIGVFALQPSALEKTDVIENSTKNSTVIDQSKFKTLHPGDVEQLGFLHQLFIQAFLLNVKQMGM